MSAEQDDEQPGVSPDWSRLRRLTPARVAIGRAGHGVPTREALRFALAHAQARDAVHVALDLDRLEAEIRREGFASLRVHSAAPDRDTYLARPDLGRRLAASSRERLRDLGVPKIDLALVVADGLSAPAVASHVAPCLAALKPLLTRAGLATGPVVLASQARVALGDEIGGLLRSRAVLVLIGERPGLSAPDSLGAYLTFGPRPGLTDADRNCVSNIRPAGLSYGQAASRLAWLVDQALRRSLTGVNLKDESDAALLEGRPASASLASPPRGRS